MTDMRDKRLWVRFDFPPGASAEAIAKGIHELFRRMQDEAAAEQNQAAEQDAGEAQPEPPVGSDVEQTDGLPPSDHSPKPHGDCGACCPTDPKP